LTLEDGVDRFSRSAGKILPLYVALYRRKAQFTMQTAFGANPASESVEM
jgi:hypothetical protein